MSNLPPAGWYPDEEPGMLRYWDGVGWTEHRAPHLGRPPAQQTASETAAPSRAEMKYAWILAVTPMIFLVVDAVFLLLVGVEGVYGTALTGAAIGLIAALVVQDSRALAKAGVRVSMWWGILLLPVYLILRTRRARSTAAVPVLWFALMVGYFAASGTMVYLANDTSTAASAKDSTGAGMEPRTGGTAGPTAGPNPLDDHSPAPPTPNPSVEIIGGAGVYLECWAGGSYGDDYYYFGFEPSEVWPTQSPDCSPTTTWGTPSPRERRALRTAYPGEPVDAAALAPLYATCAENDSEWLDELAGRLVTPDLVRAVEGALVLCPKHPQREKAARLIEGADLSGSVA